MAQLRHARTSELIAEGTPLELVTIADELGLTAIVVGAGDELPDGVDAIYDGVGLHFEPDAVRKARDANLKGLAAGGAELEEAHAAAEAELADAKARAPEVQAELEAVDRAEREVAGS